MKKKISHKEFIVVGLGRFGSSVAKQLEANGCKVLAVDLNEQRVKQIADHVTAAVCVNITNEDAAEELGIKNFDGAIISIGHNMEAAVLATIWAKEHGVKEVIAKAYDPIHGKVLQKVGADKIIYPEYEMGLRIANKLAMDNLFDGIELTSDYSILNLPVLNEWVGKNLIELKLRNKYQVNVIGVKRNGKTTINPAADGEIQKGDEFMLLGSNATLKKLANKSLSEE